MKNKSEKKEKGTKPKFSIITIILMLVVIFESIVLGCYLFVNNRNKIIVSGKEWINSYTYESTKYKNVFKFNNSNKFEYVLYENGNEDLNTKIEGKYIVVDNKIIIEYEQDDVYSSAIIYINKDYLCYSYKSCEEYSRYYNSKDKRANQYPKYGEYDATVDDEEDDEDNKYLENKPEYKKVSEPTIYIFHGDGCPHCADLLDWIKDYKYKKSYKIVKYEVWKNTDNSKLMTKVGKYLNTPADGVPFIVIGDQVITGFSSSSTPDEITKALDKAYTNISKEKYYDVIETVKK